MSGTTATILVVEDEPLIRMMAVEMIEDAGFQAIDAANAAQAVAILDEGIRVDLVFTDIDMPGGPSGLELAAFSRDRSVTVGILVTSGRMVVQPDQMPDRARFLAKPYSRAELVGTLQALLG